MGITNLTQGVNAKTPGGLTPGITAAMMNPSGRQTVQEFAKSSNPSVQRWSATGTASAAFSQKVTFCFIGYLGWTHL